MSIVHSPEQLLQLWQNPSAAYRGKPLWTWNGRLEKGELLRQIGILQGMGFGGFFMHARTGLATEYLGKEWFELVNACADEAERLGLEAWIYDEDRWPSGSAGGKATREPAFRMKYLRMTRSNTGDFQWHSTVVAAFAEPTASQPHPSAWKRLTQQQCKELSPDTQLLVFAVELMDEDSFYNGATYLDTMNPEATRKFLEVTHEQYAVHCGDRLGRSIKGVFTDEPHRGMVMSNFADHHDSACVVPWTDQLLVEFHKRFGFDLADNLPELFLASAESPISPVKWQYMELTQTLFLENFMSPMLAWCREHNLILTGHLLHEDNLVSQAVPNGSMIRNYEYLDWPGVDVLTEGNRNFWLAKQCQSAVRQLGRDWMLSELYGCTGWQLSFQGHKEVGDWQALFGVNVRSHHISWYTMEGESKRDYPASIFFQSAWHDRYRYVEDYFSRIHLLMQQGEPVCDLLVLSPLESVWAQIHQGWVDWLAATSPSIEAIETIYAEVFHQLAGAQLDFDYCDEDFLLRFGRVEPGDKGPILWIGKARYRCVVMAGMSTVRSSTLRVLEEFQRAGGRIVCAGDPPTYVDAVVSDRARQLYGCCTEVAMSTGALASACREAVFPFAEALDEETGLAAPDIYVQARDTPQGRVIMLLRIERSGVRHNVLVRLRGSGTVVRWDPRTGRRERVTTHAQGEWLELRADFGPSQEYIFSLEHEPHDLPLVVAREEKEQRVLDGTFSYRLHEPNVCVLDRASFRLHDGEWAEAQDILRVDQSVRTHLGIALRGGRMLQPWFSASDNSPRLARLGLRFSFEINDMPEDGVEVVLEHPERYRSLLLNGQPVELASTKGWWIDPCFQRVPIPRAALRPGNNVLELEMDFHANSDLEAIYLTGNFGVQLDGLRQTLIRLPAQIQLGCLTKQGLPFYGGKLSYYPSPEQLRGLDSHAKLSAPSFEAAYIRVVGREEKSQLIAFTPYEVSLQELLPGDLELEVCLTRRNTFGPLHQLPRHADFYGPDNWITQGEQFSEEWVLWPAGLLQAPVITSYQ